MRRLEENKGDERRPEESIEKEKKGEEIRRKETGEKTNI